MTRETKFGLLFVVVLTGVFGMLVYKKLHSPLGLVAGTNPQSTPEEHPAAPAAADKTAPAPLLDAGARLAKDQNSSPTPPSAAPLRPVSPNNAATPASDPFLRNSPSTTPSSTAVTPKPKLPTVIDDEFFSPPTTQNSTPNPTSAEPEFVDASPASESMPTPAATSDPFDFEPAAKTTSPQTASATESPPAFDPFADAPATTGSPATTTVALPEEAPAAAPLESDPFMEATSAPTAVPNNSGALDVPVAAAMNVESDPFGDVSTTPETSAQVPTPLPAETLPLEEPQAAAAPSMDVPAAVLKQPPTPESPEFLPAKPLPADDPFLAPEPRPAANARTTETNFNPSPAELTPPATTEVPLDVPETPRRMEPTPPSAPVMSVPRTAVLPVEPDPFGDTPRQVELPAQPQVPLPTGETPPPMLVTTARVPSPVVRPAINTGAYVVQPGDDFWKISKQVYGTGRYFQALAKHNAATVADPGRMQPGTRVATPPAQQLDALYKAEIPPGEAPQVQTLRQNHPDRYAPDAQPGFFIDRTGQPMYRIGSSDTLSAIAKNHLGRSSRWQQIFAMNRDILKDGNTLSVGAILKLPADASQVQMVGFDQQNR